MRFDVRFANNRASSYTKKICILQKKVISLPKIPSIANCIYSLVLIYFMHLEFLKIFAEAYG